MTSDSRIVRDYLARHGDTLIDQGYSVVPIQQGKKAPGFDGWQKSKSTKSQVKDWLNDGFKNAGVGILTKVTCAIDIDCLDSTTALKFERWCLNEIGDAPVRIGKAPKRLLLFRTDVPFRKLRSAVYVDDFGDKQMIEVLGDGQQFVAFHIHPDTLQPYVWVNDRSPLNVRASDLPELTVEQAERLIKAFELHAEAQDWKVHKQHRPHADSKIDHDNPWIEDSNPIEITTEELRSRLMLIPVDGPGYDQWMQVGMALKHQFSGSEEEDQEGFDLWNEWSEASIDYDKDELERKWPTFEITGKGKAPLTARFILRLSKEAVEKTTMELSIALRDAFSNAKNIEEWQQARKMAREAEIDGLARSALAQVAKDRHDAITGTRTSLVEIKKAIAYQPKKTEAPAWCEHWVYDVDQDKFYHLERKIAASKQGFDAMYDRKALSKADILNGRTTPSQTASALALNLYRIHTVDGRRYMPGRDSIIYEPDGMFANTYPEHEIPEKPDVELPRDKRNVDRVKAHIAHLLVKPVEQRAFLDALAWIVQNPGKHMNYAILLQGAEGDGKSFWGEMMRVVMGVSNVSMVNANTIVKSDFTSWAYGQCVCCVEEVRMANTRGVDKWEAINKIKPFIANNIIEVHPKGKDGISVLNTTSYIFFTNFKDAMPLDDNSRRYLVLFSQWQRKEDIQAFKSANPHYYTRLYAAIAESPGALRQWLLDHQVSDNFNPLGDAPDTEARLVMIRKSKPEFVQVLDDIIAEDKELCASRHLLNITKLSDVVMGMGVEWPGPKTLSTMLERAGYEKLGKVRIGDAIQMFYSRHPALFMSRNDAGGESLDAMKVRAYIKARKLALDDDL